MTTAADDQTQRILATVDAIPPGRVASYGQVAAEAGLPCRARLVGRVLRERTAEGLPWHRVLGADGRIKLPGRSAVEQARRLRAEGVAVTRGRVDLARCGWHPDDPGEAR